MTGGRRIGPHAISLLITEQAPAPALSAGDLQLVLPSEHRNGAAGPAEATRHCAGRVDPRVLADQTHLVDAYARPHLVMQREDRAQLIGEERLREGAGAVLV